MAVRRRDSAKHQSSEAFIIVAWRGRRARDGAQCRSLTDLIELQSAFLSKFASDYLQEAGKLDGSVAEVARHAKPLDPPHQ